MAQKHGGLLTPRSKPVQQQASRPQVNTIQSQELVKRLAFTPDNVIAAAAEQPILFHQAIELRIAALHQFLRAKTELAAAKASASIAVRGNAEKRGEKVTEDLVASRVLLSPLVQVAQQKLQDAEVKEEARKLLLEAFRQRRDSLKVIAEWRGADLRAQQAHEFGIASLEETRANLAERYPEG